MGNSIERYVIRHISGTKASQIDTFDFKMPELTFGRGFESTIQFDADHDLLVSRDHGKIVRESEDPLSFRIIDNKSRNGTFVNRLRVSGSMKLNPGDEVQLGENGPAFSFDIDPRPKDLMLPTRAVQIPSSIKATTVSPAEQPASGLESTKKGVGKLTMERMMLEERKRSVKTLVISLGGMVILAGILAYMFRVQLFGGEKNVDPPVPISQGLTPEQIARDNEDKVVQIEFGWKIYDTETNEELWHANKEVPMAGGIALVPMYIKNSQGDIEPYLKTKKYADPGKQDRPIGMAMASGSGFVISPDGFILTNRHIGTCWNSMYTSALPFPGVLVDYKEAIISINITAEHVGVWVPAQARTINGVPVGPGRVRGENTFMNVVFAGTSLRRPINAQSVTPSDKHDVALIKVDVPESLTQVEFTQNYNDIRPGQPVTVMGYPGISPQPYIIQQSNDVFNPASTPATAPTPTVTPGNIGRIVPASSQKESRLSPMGDLYQLTINATGSGNSGGPLFDEQGKVIGIFSAGSTDPDGTRITFAVPIKYGLELLGPKKHNGSD